ncbi:MAG: hypothetical protein BalsKO_30390 [Balneolaceae bacterium]
MNKKLNILGLILTLLLITPDTILAQESSEGVGGSLYSAYGIGTPLDIGSHNYRAQGVLGVSGIAGELNATLANPALWGATFITQANTGLQLSKFTLDDGSATQQNSNLASGYLHIVLPLSRGKTGISFGLYPVTQSSFRTLNSGTFTNSISETVSFANEVELSGGVNKFEVGLGFKIAKNIYLGYAPSVAFLTLENREELIFDNPSFSPQTQNTNITGAAFSQRFGISGSFQRLFTQQDNISFGATLNLPFTIASKRDFTAQKEINGIDQEVGLNSAGTNSDGDVYIPFEASFGLGYAPSPIVNFSAEGVFQKWSEFTNEINPADETVMSDRLKFGVGGQFHPYKRNSSAFFSKFKYSGGVSYDTGHLTIQGNDIRTLWINTGLGILGRNSATSFPSVDLSFQYGFRGTTDNNLIMERIWTLGFSINLNERMFIRPKLR